LSMVIALDVSLSMDARDVSPSRMERARREIRDLAAMLAGDRVGLVLFAGGAYAQMPLTLDYGTLDRLARRAGTDTIRAQGSDLGAAIDKAVELLDASDAGDKAILIISDGEDQVGDARAAAQRAADNGVHIYTIGVGTADGEPIPLARGGLKKDRAGKMVITKLDDRMLTEIAEIGQGAYVRSVAGASDMRAIYRDEIRGKLVAAEQAARREKIWQERYQWFLGAGILLLCLSYLLRPGPLRLNRHLALILAAGALAGGGDALAQDDDRIAKLTEAQVNNPDDMRIAEELSAALYQAGRYNDAARILSDIAQRAPDAGQQQRARYNAGLANYQAGKLVDAQQAWQAIVDTDPGNEAAQQNLQVVQQEIAARFQQQQQQQQQQQDQQGDQQQQQDQQQQDGQQQDQQQQDGQQTDQTQQQEQGESQQEQSESQQEHDGSFEEGPEEQALPPEAMAAGEETDEEPTQGQDGEAVSVGEPGEPGEEMSEEAAARLLDGVEEGEPRVQINPGSRGGSDW
ncbi:MAG: VWA domain-containing protein, partial [Myxococcota bacterium]